MVRKECLFQFSDSNMFVTYKLILVYILLAAEMVWKSCTTELPHTRTMNRIIIPMPSGYLSNTKRFEKMTSNWISKHNELFWHHVLKVKIVFWIFSNFDFSFLINLPLAFSRRRVSLELCCVRFAILNYLPLATSNSANSFKYVWILTMDSWLDALYAADVS